MATLFVYLDESGKQCDHKLVAMGAVCANYERIVTFNDHWNSILLRNRMTSLHMVDAVKLSRQLGAIKPARNAAQRIEDLKPFADCINEHLEVGVIQVIDVGAFREMPEKAKNVLGNPNDPYYLCFVNLVMELLDHVGSEGKINITCDDDMATAWETFRHYQGMRRAHDQLRTRLVSLAFADDFSFPTLQAADMVSYLLRKYAAAKFLGVPSDFVPLFEYLTENRPNKIEWKMANIDKEVVDGYCQSVQARMKALNMVY